MSDKNAKAAVKTEGKVENTSTNKNENKKGNTQKQTVVSPVAKVFKAKWTLDRCKRYARRFPSENVWAASAPASYKAACAHGWKDQCVAEMGSGMNSSNSSTSSKRAA